MEQEIINWAVGAIGALLGIYIKSLDAAIKTLQTDEKELITRLGGIEVLVAGSYVRKDEMGNQFELLFRKLDCISEKLDRKVDKDECQIKHNGKS